jgi:hypothetical protein
MRNSVLEEGKKSSKRGAMLLMHATLPFMSAYIALPLVVTITTVIVTLLLLSEGLGEP